MTRYACSNPSCPRRDPVTAAEPPTCYTCAQPMAAVCPLGCSTGYAMPIEKCSHGNWFAHRAPVRTTYDPNRTQISFNGIGVNGVLDGPLVEIPESAPLFADDITFNDAPVKYNAADSLALGQRIAAALRAALPPPTVKLTAPEPTPEQRARRELGPIAVTVTRSVVPDLEAFKRDLEAAILEVIRS